MLIRRSDVLFIMWLSRRKYLHTIHNLASLARPRIAISFGAVVIRRPTISIIAATTPKLRPRTRLVPREIRPAAAICRKPTFIRIARPGVAISRAAVVLCGAAVPRRRAAWPEARVVARYGRAACAVCSYACAVATACA